MADFKNVSIVAHYIKEQTKNAQFIIIRFMIPKNQSAPKVVTHPHHPFLIFSLRNNMFELADRLVGIYKTDNCTKSVTINPRSFSVASHKKIAV